MHISRVTVHGFKSYDDTVVFGPFAKGKNALVGLNGTGKSNFYAAIGFVLLDEYAHIRITDRKALLHEGQGQSAMTAYVEIVLDNKSHNIPIDNDEVSIRRSIGLKKDEYFIDRKNSTRQDVHNLLESCGFSPSSGYYIVRQGKVNALALMKDSDRLDLLYEIAGTKFYDQQREESVKMIEESKSRTVAIEESLDYIRDRISQLEKEKAELEEYEKLDKEKRAVEHLIQNIELSRIQEDIEEKEESHRIESEEAAEYQQNYDTVHKNINDLQDKLEDFKADVTRLSSEKEKIQKRKNDSLKNKTRTEIKIDGLRSKLENTEVLQQKYSQELEKVKSEIEYNQNLLNEVNEQYAEVSKEKGIVQGQFDALSQIIKNKTIDPSSTESELRRAQSKYNTLCKQEKSEIAKLDEFKERLDQLQEIKKKIDEQLSSQYTDHAQKTEELNTLMNTKKELWNNEDQNLREIRKIEQKLEKLRAKINSTIPADFSAGIDAVKKMDHEGVYGPIYDLISCPDELSIAVSAVGKGRLFSIVVEDDEVGETLINELQKNKSGVASFLPLNVINKNKYTFPEGVTSLVSQLEFDPKFKNAMNLVFGKTILADSMIEASELVKQHNLDVVTREGELFSANGPITGGSKSHNRSPIYIQTLISRNEEHLEKITARQNQTSEELKEVEQKISELNKELTDSKVEKERKKQERIKTNLEISDIQDEIEGKTSQLERLRINIEEAHRNYLSVEKKLNYIKEFNSPVDDDTREQLNKFRHRNDELTKTYSELYRKRVELSSTIKDSLNPRQKRLIEDLDSLDSEKISRQLEVLQRENEIAVNNLEEATSQIDEIDNKLTESINSVSTTENEITELQGRKENIKSTLNDKKNHADKIFSEISLLKQRQEECIKQDKDKGALPEAEIEEFREQSMSELMRHLRNINLEAQKYRYVNKKAIEQHKAFKQQEQELIKRQEELKSSSESIDKLIETLDTRKEEAIANTFSQISENFTLILQELEPHAKGQLVLQRDEETNEYTGVTIIAQFENQEVVSLAQLSGGQKALIALTLIFSIQKYAPAPFYLFDEVDSALDDKYRLAVSKLMNKFCHPTDNSEPAQIIFTTFKKELLDSCDKYFAVKYNHGHSTSLEISEEDADKIISEQNEYNDNY